MPSKKKKRVKRFDDFMHGAGQTELMVRLANFEISPNIAKSEATIKILVVLGFRFRAWLFINSTQLDWPVPPAVKCK